MYETGSKVLVPELRVWVWKVVQTMVCVTEESYECDVLEKELKVVL